MARLTHAMPRHRPRKRFGQHFLVPSWAAKLVSAIDPQPNQTFLEIGPGKGAITRRLAERAAAVVAVEVDRDLAATLRAEAINRLTVIEADVLDVDMATLGLPAGTRVAGNLPYNISSPILFQLLGAQRRLSLFADATLMLQKEVADRLTASPGTKDYGPLTVFTALDAQVTRLLTLPPGAFHPPPKVTSAVVRVRFLSANQRPVVPAAFESVVRALFTARRKTIANGLKAPAAAAGTTPGDALARADLDPRLRPEQLSVNQLLALARAVGCT
jgi:16S rRNA (adenine1518-N6/adenine1519-N6)-dimethyltransferase